MERKQEFLFELMNTYRSGVLERGARSKKGLHKARSSFYETP
jgi:hypothetical protein